MPFSKSLFHSIIAFCILSIHATFGQSIDFQYMSPLPGAEYVMPGTSLLFSAKSPLESDTFDKINIKVSNQEGGFVRGKNRLINDGRTIQFLPSSTFKPGEQIDVIVSGEEGSSLTCRGKQLEYSFTISPVILSMENYREATSRDDRMHASPSKKIPHEKRINHRSSKSLPEDFTVIDIVNSDHPPEQGYFFIAPMSGYAFPEAKPYIVIFDPYGTPVFYKKQFLQNNDLKMQRPGVISYFVGYPDYQHIVLDSKYELVISHTAQNGYPIADHHDFVYTEENHAFLMIYDPQLVGMDTVVPGGHPEATVIGLVIQELDEDKNVVFQWRSWDHFLITDATEHESLTDSTIDYVHGNSIELVGDTAMIISNRNMCEITKIDRRTGDIIWRLGGKNNMFTIIDDTLGFSYQHDARLISNGNLTIFDNGSFHPVEPPFSSVLEYELDETEMTATKVRRLRNDPDIFGIIMGNAQESEDGRTIVGWGSGVPGITEFLDDGTKAMEVYIDAFSYRAFRFDWEPEAITFYVDSLKFGDASPGNAVTEELVIRNNRNTELEINNIEAHSQYFTAADGELPLLIPSNSSRILTLAFTPDSTGLFFDLLTICSDIESEELTRRIARQIRVTGTGKEGAGLVSLSALNASVYPNPTEDGRFMICLENGNSPDFVRVYDLNGNLLISTGEITGNHVNISGLSAGVYYLRIVVDRQTAFGKVVKL
jgi:hypothetical protein